MHAFPINPIAFWILMIVVSSACNRLDQPIPSTAINASRSANQPESPDNSGHRYASDESPVLPNTIPQELLDRIQRYKPDTAKARQSVKELIDKLRTENEWLDESFKALDTAPLLTKDGKNPGPNTATRLMQWKSLSELLLKDYLENSKESDADKQELAALYERNIIDLLAEREPDDATQTKIFSKFQAGNFDPMLLYLNLEYDQLSGENRRKVSAKVAAAIRSRKCSAETVLAIVALTDTRVEAITIEDRIYLTQAVLSNVPDFLRHLKPDDAHFDIAQSMLCAIQGRLPAAGQLDLLRLVVDLREGPNGDTLVPDAMLHQYLRNFYWKIALRARGGDFMSEVSRANVEIFERFGMWATDHAMIAFVSDPGNPFLTKDLMAIQLMLSSTPFSQSQLYRIGMLTQCDSRNSASEMSWSLMSRWGGSRQQVQQFANLLIDQTVGSKDNQICFDIAITHFLKDQGWFDNLAQTTQLDESVVRLFDHLLKINGDQPDTRLNTYQIALIGRLLWDSGDLVRLQKLNIVYRGLGSSDAYYSCYLPVWLANLTICAHAHPNAPQQAIVTLQQALLCGDEKFDDARVARIDQAIESLKAFLTSDNPTQSSPLNSTETTADDITPRPTETVVEAHPVQEFLDKLLVLRDYMVRYRAGEQVNIIGNATPWTHYGNTTLSFNAASIDINVRCQFSNLLLAQPLRFEMPFIVELDFTQGECDADPYGIALFAGQVSLASTDSDQSGRSLRYAPGYPMIMQDRLPAERLKGQFYHEERPLAVLKSNTLKMDVSSEGVLSYVNDKLITRTTYPINTGGHIQIGRIAGDTFAGVPDKSANYKITALKVQKRANSRTKNDSKNVGKDSQTIPQGTDAR